MAKLTSHMGYTTPNSYFYTYSMKHHTNIYVKGNELKIFLKIMRHNLIMWQIYKWT
jgi:hypothetical protein